MKNLRLSLILTRILRQAVYFAATMGRARVSVERASGSRRPARTPGMGRARVPVERARSGVITRALGALCGLVLWAGSGAGLAGVAYQVETVAEGLAFPWSLAFLPDGDMLVTEREGRLRIVRDDQLDPTPIGGVPETYVRGQGGFFDILLDPDYAGNGRVYLSYSAGSRGANFLAVGRASFHGMNLTGFEVILRGEPSKDTPHHYGGRMAFLADGTLLVVCGDGFDYREQALDLSSLLGKTLRINRDGSVPPDNPFVGHDNARPEIWTYGHRNQQGIVATPQGVYLHEHGPRGGDELNLVEPGNNYGWPAITYGMDYVGSYISPYTAHPGMNQPVVYWTPSIAPAGLAYYEGDAFPSWRGNLFVAALVEQSVRRLTLKDNQVADQEILFTELGMRLRDVRTGPDGYLYLLTDSADGKVLRIKPASEL